MERRTAETLKSLAVTTIGSIRQPVATLSGGQRQSVAVAKAVQWNSKLVILDEPTAALGVAQTEQVLALVNRLAEQGLSVVLISHNLHDIFETAHRITVLRLGRNAGVYERAKTTQQEVVQAITAGAPTKVSGIPETASGASDVTTEVDVVGQDRTAARRSRTAAGRARPARLGQPPLRQPRRSPARPRARLHRRLLQLQGDELLHGRQLHQHRRADGGDDDARLRRRLRPPARRDRPLDLATSPGSAPSPSRFSRTPARPRDSSESS